ncbi:MAG TPA: response regulator transcription factor [Acidimicrobiales bacterium]|nr:response regulator transcription factor [Acidimicrobiales bacterium]
MTAAPLQAKVLVVEDEADISQLVAGTLESEGFAVVRAMNGMEAMERLEKDRPDLVILDVMMPVISGLEVLQHIRQKGNTPVILLTALESEDNRVRGLQLGADDYIVKPFSLRELSARVSALLRRAGMVASAAPVIEYPGLRIDLTGREVWVRGELVETTAKEFDLLAFLAAAPGRVFTRHQLLRDVWQSSSEFQQEGTVTEHVRRLRTKVEDDAENPRWLHTVRGVGYRFDRRHTPRDEPASS